MALATAICAVVSFVSDARFDVEEITPCSDAGCDFRLAQEASAAKEQANTPEVTIVAAPPVDFSPDPCPWTEVKDLGASSSWWEGNDPSAGHIELNRCTSGNWSVLGGGVIYTRFVPNATPGVAAAPAPPDPAVLAREAIGRLVVPRPTIGAGPDRTKLAVNLWTWLWVDDPPPVSVTVALGGVSVTATATLTSTTWSLGEPASTGNGYQAGPPVTITCVGAGTAPPPGYDWKAKPPCGHMFHWRSLKERTGGAGTWPITATTTWAVAWQSNTGAAGADTLTATAGDQFDVAEYRIVLVGPGG